MSVDLELATAGTGGAYGLLREGVPRSLPAELDRLF